MLDVLPSSLMTSAMSINRIVLNGGAKLPTFRYMLPRPGQQDERLKS